MCVFVSHAVGEVYLDFYYRGYPIAPFVLVKLIIKQSGVAPRIQQRGQALARIEQNLRKKKYPCIPVIH